MFVDTLSKLTGDLTLVPKKISQLLFKSLSTITQLNTRHGNNTEIIFSRIEYETRDYSKYVLINMQVTTFYQLKRL